MTTSEPTTRTGLYEGEIRIEATPDVVYRYLTEPELITRWNGEDAELDPRPGGVYRINVQGRHVASGTVVEAVPTQRVSYTFGWEEEGHPIPPGSTLVEIDLEPDGAATIVRLRHSGLPEDAVADHSVGWGHYLARLATAATGADPGADTGPAV